MHLILANIMIIMYDIVHINMMYYNKKYVSNIWYVYRLIASTGLWPYHSKLYILHFGQFAFLNLVYFFVYFASFICCQRISICEDELSFGEGRFDFIFISKISAASISSFIGLEGKLNIILYSTTVQSIFCREVVPVHLLHLPVHLDIMI